MTFKNILLFIFINLLLNSCIKTHKSPLSINVNEVETMEIIDVIGYFENDSLIKKDTIIPIIKKDWNILISNFNDATSKFLFKSVCRYEIIIKKKHKKETVIRCSSNEYFKITGDWRYKFTEESTKVLDSYYKVNPN